jgi:hypothetical protein
MKGACTRTATTATKYTDGTLDDTKIYAKSAFYEEPNLTADKCTHFSKWNHDPIRVSYCKEYTTELTCNNINALNM